ncbi:hypothetical protein, partial [Pseudomonas marginalis]|uniref:hypothetical protein n=1 Tax=Pseudomonas marginalis TaxID=298 RepID=UPI002B1D612D
LYSSSFVPIFAALKAFIAHAGLTPYNIKRRKSEFKIIIVTESRIDGRIMLRFVFGSEKKIRFVLSW